MPQELAADSKVHFDEAHWLRIWRLRVEGGRAYRGRSVMCLGFVTEGTARCLDCMAEVGKGHSSSARDEGLNDEKEQ